MTSRPLVKEEAILEELVDNRYEQFNRNFDNVNWQFELIELPNDSILPTGLRFIDLSILPDAFSLLACPYWSTANTVRLLDIREKKNGHAKFMQIRSRDCEFKHSFYSAPQTDSI